jgi:hypothetical protein
MSLPMILVLRSYPQLQNLQTVLKEGSRDCRIEAKQQCPCRFVKQDVWSETVSPLGVNVKISNVGKKHYKSLNTPKANQYDMKGSLLQIKAWYHEENMLNSCSEKIEIGIVTQHMKSEAGGVLILFIAYIRMSPC